jgi:hypothetical protein
MMISYIPYLLWKKNENYVDLIQANPVTINYKYLFFFENSNIFWIPNKLVLKQNLSMLFLKVISNFFLSVTCTGFV